MSEPTPRPWKLSESTANYIVTAGLGEDYPIALINLPGNYPGAVTEAEANAAHIVKCVNYHKRLVEALRPLAAFADEKCLRNKSDDFPQFGLNGAQLTVGEFRNARALLAEIEKGQQI